MPPIELKKRRPPLETTSVRPIIVPESPLAEADGARALMESSEHMGEIVLKPS